MSFGCSGNRGQSIDIYSSMEEEFVNKKIVILNGSPREKGNTAALVNAFSKGAEEAGNTVRIFWLGKMEIHGCKGCFGGKNEEEYPCVQKDDNGRTFEFIP